MSAAVSRSYCASSLLGRAAAADDTRGARRALVVVGVRVEAADEVSAIFDLLIVHGGLEAVVVDLDRRKLRPIVADKVRSPGPPPVYGRGRRHERPPGLLLEHGQE